MLEEIFVVVDNKSEKTFVDRLNSEEARITRRRRFKALAEAGRLHEAQMPDSYEVIVGIVRENQLRREALERQAKAAAIWEKETVEVRNLHMLVDRFEIALVDRAGYVKMDGEPLKGVQAVTVHVSAYGNPKVTLEMIPSAVMAKAGTTNG